MSRRKQSNPQHLGTDRDPTATSTFENGPPPGDAPVTANEHNPTTEGADEVNGDVHVCGKCRGEFIIISEFLQHKETCCKDPTVLIVNDREHHDQGENNENTDDNQQHPQNKTNDNTDITEERELKVSEEESELKSLVSLVNGDEERIDKVEEGIKTLSPELPKSEADDSQEPMDFSSMHPPLIPKSENGRPSIINGLTSLPLPPSNLALASMEATKFAVSQLRHGLAGMPPPTPEDMVVIQDQLYTLQQQHLQQLNLIQHIQQQVNTYTSQQQKLDAQQQREHREQREQPPTPKSTSPTPSSTSSTPTLPTISLPTSSQPPPPPHLLSPPTSTAPVLPPSFERPLPPGHPTHRPGPPPPPGLLGPAAFPLPPHRPPFELLQQAAIPPVSSPLHSVPPSPFGGPRGLLGLHGKPKPPSMSIFDSKFSADDPFFRHKCRYCHKVFGSDSALQIHIRSHTGERPFKCNICGNRFSTKGNLKVHFQRHQARYPHIHMDCTPHPPSPPPHQPERPNPLGPSPIHPPSIHQVPMPTIPNDVAKLPMETTNSSSSHQAIQPSSGSPNTSTNSEDFQMKVASREWHPPTSSPDDSRDMLLERPPRPLSEPPRPASEPVRSPAEPRPLIERPASSSDITLSRSPVEDEQHEVPMSPPTPSGYFPPSSSESLYLGWENPFTSTPSSLKLLAEQGFRPSETSKLQELVENIEQKITNPNQCVICHRVLSCKSALQMHYRIHTGERPFRCKVCSRSFTTKGNLKTHYGVHRLQPPMRMYHDCPICQKRFTNAIVLQQHLRLHAAEGIPIPTSMNFMRPEHMGQYGPEIALQRPMPMMMNGHHHPYDRERPEGEKDASRPLTNGPSVANGPKERHGDKPEGDKERRDDEMTGGRDDEMTGGRDDEMARGRDDEMTGGRDDEMARGRDDEMARGRDDGDEGLTEKDIEEAMFTPSDASQDAASPSASFNGDGQQEMPRERQPMEIDLASHHSRFDHQRSLDNITNALKMKMSGAPLNNNTEIRGPINDGHFSEPQSPFTDQNSMTSEKALEVQSINEDALDHPLHIDESSNNSKLDNNGVLDLTSRSSGETSPSMPQSQGLPTSTAAMFAGLGAPNLLLAQGPGGLIYPPGRRPAISNNTTCRFCGKVFACTSALQIHYRSHTKERPFKCDICGKGFSTRGNLKQHMLTHKIRDLPSQLFDPSQIQMQNNPTMVPLPPKVPMERPTERPSEPRIELPKSESEQPRPQWPKPESEQPPPQTQPQLQKPDTQPVHPSLKRPSPPTSRENEPPFKQRTLKHQCGVCEKQFQSDSALQIHMRTHTGEKPFKCHICGRAFTTKGNMKVHMGTHMWNGGTRRGRRIAFDPPLIISPKEGEVFRNDFLGMRPPYDSGFFQYPSPLNGFTALSKANEISVIQNHQTGPQQAHIPESPNSVIMKADGPNPEMRELRELREMQENKMREIHEKSMRELHENSFREMHENSLREMHENKIREIHDINKMRELHESKLREMHESKMRELHESKIREMHESSIREMRENTIRELRENAMREMRESALREMRESTMREMRGTPTIRESIKPDVEPERLTTA